VGLQDLVVFTRQLATMIDAGLAMVQCLQALAEQTPNRVMREMIKDVCTRVEGGDSFSDALKKHPKNFDRLYTCMVVCWRRFSPGWRPTWKTPPASARKLNLR
jgi:type IV pilus assembly protein PilC